STGNGYGSFFLRGFLVVIVSIMEHPFRYYFMTPFHTEILTGSASMAQLEAWADVLPEAQSLKEFFST
ncbi:hypothetical protein GTP44_21450, partial [Duganella sp. FT50W]